MKKNSRALLQEEIGRHLQILEYSFYKGDDDDRYTKDVDNLILGEDDEDPNDFTPIDGDETPEMDNQGSDMEEPVQQDVQQPVEVQPQIPPEQPQGDEVELDVTQLVNGTDEAKMTAEMGIKKMEELLMQFKGLEDKLSSIETISNKMDSLEKEIERRNPTPVEKLQMRSLDSFPYNIKLSDYWNEKHPGYDPVGSEEETEQEYVLKQSDIDNEYSESEIKNSFNRNI